MSLKMNTSTKLDEQIAPKDFFERLCLVKTSDTKVEDVAVTSGNEVAAYQLWPAVKYNSYKELQEQIKDRMLRGKIAVEYNKLCRTLTNKADKDEYGIAYLLGRGKDQSTLVFVPKNSEGIVVEDDKSVFDFYIHADEIERAVDGEGYCGSAQFQAAYTLANNRMAQHLEIIDEKGLSPSPKRGVDVKKERTPKEANIYTASSARKTTILEVNYSQKSSEKGDSKKQAVAAAPTPARKSSTSFRRSKTKGDGSVEAETTAPIKTVEFSGDGASGSVSSPETWHPSEKPPSYADDDQSEIQSESFSPNSSRSAPNNVRKSTRSSPSPYHSSPVVNKKMSWAEMYNQMTADGWFHIGGSGLVEWYYVQPRFKGMLKTEILKQGKEGEDYFTSEESLKSYARSHLGWKTDNDVRKSKSPQDADMADRIKKRKRGATKQQQQQQPEVKPVVKTKRVVKVAGRGTKVQQKKVAPKREPSNSPARSETSEGSEMSRFSQDPTAASPTVSEAEADIGVVKSAKKKKKTTRELKFESQDGSNTSSPSNSIRSTRSKSSASKSSASETSSNQSSLDAAYQVMASSDAWKVLMKQFGFSFYGGKYCFPGKENRPRKDSSAVQGVNYFNTIEDLRKHLCAYGLPEVTGYLDENETKALGLWVRFANVVGLGDAPKIDPKDVEDINGREAWSMLSKLGLKYGGGVYSVPNSDPSMVPFRFERQQDYTVHLARFGIPRIDGILQNEVLSRDDRLRLDLYIASTEVDSFKRIDFNSELVNKITPRRSRSGRGRDNETDIVKKEVEEKSDPNPFAQSKQQTDKNRRFKMEFNVEHQRTLPSQLISSEEALNILTNNYNIDNNNSFARYYCLPGVESTDDGDSRLGCDYFETLRDLRESLCAYGMPPVASGSKLSNDSERKLEAWVRCANIESLCFTSEKSSLVPIEQTATPNVPEFEKVLFKEAKKVLKAFGYTISANTHTFLLPGTTMHNSKLGHDQFDQVIDLINHIARFGLDTFHKSIDCQISDEEKTKFEIFCASVATFDVRNRVESVSPLKRKSLTTTEQLSNETAQAMASLPTDKTTAAKAEAATPSNHAAVVEEGDQETPPQPSPQKKAEPNTITKFFSNSVKKVGGVMADVFGFSPDRRSSDSLPTHNENDADEFAAASNTTSQKLSPPMEAASTTKDVPDKKEFTTPKSSVDVGQGISSTVEHFPQAESPTMPWKNLWSQMRAAGWVYCAGDLVAWYWVHPSAAKMRKRDMIRDCIDGVHYFSSEKAIQQYAVANLGWKGEDGNIEFSPTLSTTSLAGRAKKRSRTNAALASDETTSSPSKKSRRSSVATTLNNNETAPTKKRSSPRNKGSDDEVAKASQSKSSDSSANSQSSSDKTYIAPPDKQSNVKDKLECCQMVLHPCFKKNQLSKSNSMSVVSSMEDDIKDFMTKSIETGRTEDGMTLPSPGFMYICGGPGTGKTTAVTSCADDMKKWAKRNGYDKPKFCFINMASSQTSASNCKDGIMRTMLKKIATSIEVDKQAKLSVFEKKFKKQVLVLILDEVDMLFKEHGGIGETWFRTLIEWAEDKELKFSMIGISNCVNDGNAVRVREIGHSPRELVFAAYKEADILAILEQRLGKNIVDHKALQLISRRVAASSGDARRALEITSNAVGKCADLLSRDKLDMIVDRDDECMPLVKLPHMMRAIREAMPMRHTDVIAGLPQAAKVVLCIAVSLSQVWGPTAEISVSTLKRYCVEATHHAIMDELGIGHVFDLVGMLMDSGLLVAGNRGQFDPHDVNSKLMIGIQLDDVQIALEQSLLKEGGFYKSLVDYVKRECPSPS